MTTDKDINRNKKGDVFMEHTQRSVC